MRISLRSTVLLGGLFLLLGALQTSAQCHTPEDLARKANCIREELQFDFSVVEGALTGDSLLFERIIYDRRGKIDSAVFIVADTSVWKYECESVDGRSFVTAQSVSLRGPRRSSIHNTFDAACNWVETTTIMDGDTVYHQSMKYDEDNRLIRLSHFSSRETYGQSDVTYDADGNGTILTYLFDRKNDSAVGGTVARFEYDDQRRLIANSFVKVRFEGSKAVPIADEDTIRVERDYDTTGLLIEERTLTNGVLTRLTRSFFIRFDQD